MKKIWPIGLAILALFAVSVSAQTQQNSWITYGLAGYEELRKAEFVAGQSGLNDRILEMSATALAYDAVPLARAHELGTDTPDFKILANNKGGMVIWMLEGVMGRDNLEKATSDFRSKFVNGTGTVDDFRAVAEEHYGKNLAWFFDQWVNSIGAPSFQNEYVVRRNRNGFLVVGKISQDLDLFRVALELKIATEGNPETQTIEVSGTSTQYAIQTFGRPKPGGITIDPANRVLKNSPALRLRAAILKGEHLFQKGDFTGAIGEYQKALEMNKFSSLAHYRAGEVFFSQKNYQAAANEFRAAIDGDLNPKWTEVWSRICLGKLFDMSGQRERAVNEYSRAQQTNDDSFGAQAEAERLISEPYKEKGN